MISKSVLAAALLGVFLVPGSIFKSPEDPAIPTGGRPVFSERSEPLPPVTVLLALPEAPVAPRDAARMLAVLKPKLPRDSQPRAAVHARRSAKAHKRLPSREKPRPEKKALSEKPEADTPMMIVADRLFAADRRRAALRQYEAALRDEFYLLSASQKKRIRARIRECRAPGA